MKIPKIILILVIIAILFVSCDDAMPLDPEEIVIDFDKVATLVYKSTFYPSRLMIVPPDEYQGDFVEDFMEGLSLNLGDPNVYTWDQFDVGKVTDNLNNENFEDIFVVQFLEIADDFDNLNEGEIIIESGTGSLNLGIDPYEFFVDMVVKFETENESINGTFSIEYFLKIEMDGTIIEEDSFIKVEEEDITINFN